jgi:hypothetical protein
VNLRYIVPALGLAALSTSSFAADMMPAVSFSGWVDAVAQYSDARQDNTATDQLQDNPASGKDDSAGNFRFTGQASIKANIQVTDTLSGKLICGLIQVLPT